VLTELLSIAGNVRSVATVLAVLVATKLNAGDDLLPPALKPI
jgi:hypothetical protein